MKTASPSWSSLGNTYWKLVDANRGDFDSVDYDGGRYAIARDKLAGPALLAGNVLWLLVAKQQCNSVALHTDIVYFGIRAIVDYGWSFGSDTGCHKAIARLAALFAL
jgi:hypothetical protein